MVCRQTRPCSIGPSTHRARMRVPPRGSTIVTAGGRRRRAAHPRSPSGAARATPHGASHAPLRPVVPLPAALLPHRVADLGHPASREPRPQNERNRLYYKGMRPLPLRATCDRRPHGPITTAGCAIVPRGTMASRLFSLDRIHSHVKIVPVGTDAWGVPYCVRWGPRSRPPLDPATAAARLADSWGAAAHRHFPGGFSLWPRCPSVVSDEVWTP